MQALLLHSPSSPCNASPFFLLSATPLLIQIQWKNLSCNALPSECKPRKVLLCTLILFPLTPNHCDPSFQCSASTSAATPFLPRAVQRQSFPCNLANVNTLLRRQVLVWTSNLRFGYSVNPQFSVFLSCQLLICSGRCVFFAVFSFPFSHYTFFSFWRNAWIFLLTFINSYHH